jgi:hypothetical protein
VRYLARPRLSPPTRPGAFGVDDEVNSDEHRKVGADPEEPVEYVVALDIFREGFLEQEAL